MCLAVGLGMDWTIVQHTGQRMDLERGSERKEVKAPKDPQKLQHFRNLAAGELIDDATIAHFLTDK